MVWTGQHRPDVRELVERFYRDAWNRWDDAAVDELLAPDFLFRGSLGDEARGRDGFRAYRDKVRAAFPDFHNEVLDVVAGALGPPLACAALVPMRATSSATHRRARGSRTTSPRSSRATRARPRPGCSATSMGCATTRQLNVMGDPGLEPGTSSLSEKRSNRLS